MTQRSPIESVGPEDFPRARAIFESVLDRPPAERTILVEEACAGDMRLLSAVLAMLRSDAEPHSVLDGRLVHLPGRWQPGDAVAGHFRIVAILGRGGMGEVYRTHDTKLDREVALKILPDAFAADVERIARFQREAKVLASLNHPNIATIHGFEQVGDVHALVMELVPGEDLSQRIARGAIPLAETLAISRQITNALEAAHEQGIIHRDLKPANIKLRPDGTVKVLDFGLAKAFEPVGGEPNVTQSPTITTPAMTQAGIILGTAAYMSPEQARGKQADKRADVWAFGAILHEMLSGERVFKGDDVAETLAAVLRADIDGSGLPASTPVALRHLVTRCLDRDVSRRLRDIGEARIVLEDLSTGSRLPGASSEQTRNGRRWRWRHVIAPAVVAIVGAAAAAVALWPRTSPSTLPVTRFVLSTPAGQTLLLDPQSRDITITPDGTRVVYKGGARLDKAQLFSYPLDQLAPQPLTEPGYPKGPFASPDGRWIGFFEPGGGSGAALKKIAVSGGPPVDISRLDGSSRGATWIDNDTIIAASGASSTGLLRIPASGGAFSVLTRPDRARGEGDHFWPQFLTGAGAVLFTITALNGDITASQVAVLDLTSGTWKTLIRGASQGHYVSGGHLVYFAGGALWRITLDLTRMATVGTASVVVPHVVMLPTGVAEFDIAGDGTLVYVARGGAGDAPRRLVWVDRQGQEAPIAAEPRPYSGVRLSPDGTRVALEAEGDLRVWDFAHETLTAVTTGPGLDQSPVWTPDGLRLVFTSQAGGVESLFWKAADGSGSAERLTEGHRLQRASDVMSDGSGVLFGDGDGLQFLALDRGHHVTQLIRGSMGGVASPDRRWLAYVARDSRLSSPQVFVSSFDNPEAGRTLVSRGTQPHWARDGRELFYTSEDGVLMSAPVRGGATPGVDTPTPVLGRRYYTGFAGQRTYDVTPGGRRFLMLKQDSAPDQSAEPATVVVVKNWIEDLKRLGPSR